MISKEKLHFGVPWAVSSQTIINFSSNTNQSPVKAMCSRSIYVCPGTAGLRTREFGGNGPGASISIGGLAAFPGEFVTVRCGYKDWDKSRQRGVYQPFILAMQPITLLVIHLMRSSSATTTQLDWTSFAFIPAALLGAWLGLRIFKRLCDRQFELAVNLLLVV